MHYSPVPSSSNNKTDNDEPNLQADSTIFDFYQNADPSSLLLLPTMKKKKEVLKKKRLDLQGIRGLAIISVLGFHFLPSLFPNGYLGVDQFFVLSGFLMCMLLQRSYKSSQSMKSNWVVSTCTIIIQFYYKRLKRILPLYFLLIFAALLALYYIFPDTAYETNISSGERALFFVSNRVATLEEDYFTMLDIAVDIFTHTWSLSVEVQFYVIVPFLFLFGVKVFSEKFQLFYYITLGFISFWFSSMYCTENQAFNNVFARVWQFTIGMTVFNITTSTSPENKQESQSRPSTRIPLERNFIMPKVNRFVKYLLITAMSGIVAYPHELPDQLLRPFFTIATGVLMVVSANNFLLSSRFLTYIGDISYSLYLTHWPIYAFWKLVMSNDQLWNIQLLLCFFLAFVLSILSYEAFEKWYLKLSATSVTIICLVLFILNIGALKRYEIEDWIENRQPKSFTRLDGLGGNRTYTFEEAAYLNRRWSKDDIKNLIHPTCKYETGNGPFGWCRHKGLRGDYKLMIIGNSWAANHARIIYEECGHKAKSIIQGSAIGCDPLYSYNYGGDRCKENVKIFEKRVVEEKPDYVFLLSRFIDISDNVNVTNVKDDPIFQSMKNQANKLIENVTYKMFILTSIPEIEHANVEKIVATVQNGKDLIKFDKSFVHASPESARQRHAKLIEDCPRCYPIDYKPLFWNTTTNTWRYYDVENSGLSYMTQIDHLNFHGLELVRNVYRSICRKL